MLSAAINTDMTRKKDIRVHCMVLLYSSAAINMDVNGGVCGALVKFGRYQHVNVKAPSILG